MLSRLLNIFNYSILSITVSIYTMLKSLIILFFTVSIFSSAEDIVDRNRLPISKPHPVPTVPEPMISPGYNVTPYEALSIICPNLSYCHHPTAVHLLLLPY